MDAEKLLVSERYASRFGGFDQQWPISGRDRPAPLHVFRGVVRNAYVRRERAQVGPSGEKIRNILHTQSGIIHTRLIQALGG